MITYTVNFIQKPRFEPELQLRLSESPQNVYLNIRALKSGKLIVANHSPVYQENWKYHECFENYKNWVKWISTWITNIEPLSKNPFLKLLEIFCVLIDPIMVSRGFDETTAMSLFTKKIEYKNYHERILKLYGLKVFHKSSVQT